MPDEKEPIPKFAKRIKDKYPEYRDIEDTLLVQKIVAKYPEYADQVDMGGEVKKKDWVSSTFGGGSKISLGAGGARVNSKPSTKSLSSGLASVEGIEPVQDEKANLQSLTAVKNFKKNETPFDQTKEEYIKESSKKLGDIMYGEGDDWKDPLKASISGIKKSATTKDALGYHGAMNLTEQSLMPDGFEANRILNSTHFGNSGDDNLTAKALRNKVVDYEKSVAPFRGINPDELTYLTKDKLYDAAIRSYANKNPNFKKQLEAAGIDINTDDIRLRMGDNDAKMGQVMSAVLNNPDLHTFIQKENPDLLPAIQDIQENLIYDNKDYGKVQLANEISRDMQKEGYNKIDPIFNFEENAKGAGDATAETLYANDPKKLQFYRDNKEDILNKLDAPSLLTGFAEAGRGFGKGIINTFEQPFESLPKTIKEGWEKEASHVSADPKGLVKFLSDSGHALGFVASIGATGNVLGAAGLGSNAASMTSLGVGFLGDNLEQAKMKYPDSPVKQWTSALFNTGLYMAMGKSVFPAAKVEQAFAKVQPGVSKTIENLASGKITREAARAELNSFGKQALEIAGSGLQKNIKVSAEMTGIAMLNKAMDKILGMDEQTFKEYHPEGEESDTFKSMFLSNIIVNGLAARGQVRAKNDMAKESIYEAASNPNRYRSVIEASAISKNIPETKDMLDNLNYVVNLKKELDMMNLSEKQKKDYLFNGIQSKVLNESKPSSPDATLARRHQERIKNIEEINEGILAGKDADEVVTTTEQKAIDELQKVKDEGDKATVEIEKLTKNQELDDKEIDAKIKGLDKESTTYSVQKEKLEQQLKEKKEEYESKVEKLTKPSLISQALEAVDKDLPEYLRAIAKEDIEGTLRDAAEQLNSTSGEAATARKIYGKTLSDIALKLFPDAKTEIDPEGKLAKMNEEIEQEKAPSTPSQEGSAGSVGVVDVKIDDKELYDKIGKDASDYIKKSETQLGDGVIDRNRIIKTAEKIAKLDGKSKVDIAAVAEAVHIELAYENKFDDLRKAGEKETVQRMIDVGVDLPNDISNKFKKADYDIKVEKGDYGTQSYDLKSDNGKVSGHIGDAYDWKNNKKIEGKEMSVARIDAKEIGKGQGEELLKSVIDYANKNDIKFIGSTSLNEASRKTFEKLEKQGLIKPALQGVNNKTITWEIAEQTPSPKEGEQSQSSKVTEGGKGEDLGISEKSVNLQSDAKTGENISSQENKGTSNSPQPSREESPEKLQKRYERVIGETDLTDPYDRVLDYFSNKGKINGSAIDELFGGKDKRIHWKSSTENERRAKIGLIDKDGLSLSKLGETLANRDPKEENDSQVYINAIEQVLLDHNSKSSMQQALVDKYDLEVAYEKYAQQKMGKEAIDIVEKMTEEDIDFLLKMEADKKTEEEISNHIDEIIQTKSESPKSESSKQSSDTETKSNTDSKGSKEPPKPPKEEKPIVEGDGDAKGITHAANEVRRMDRALPEYQKEPQSFEEWNSKAEKAIKEGYDVDDLIDRIEKGHDPTPVENAIRKIYVATLDAEITKNPTDALLAKQKKFIEAGDLANSRAGRNLVSLKGENSPLSSLSDFYVAKMEAAGVDKLTEQQKKETKDAFDNVQKADQNATAAMEAYREEIAKLKAENELLKQKKAPTKKGDWKQQRKDAVEGAREALKKIRTGESGVGVSIPIVRELIAIAPHVKKYVGAVLGEGVYNLKEVVTKAYEEFKDVLEGITEKDIHDIIAGEYNEKKPTRNELAAKMRDLRDEAYYINKLERLLKGEEPKSEKKKVERNRQITELQQKIKDFYKAERDAAKVPKEVVDIDLKKLEAIKKRNETEEAKTRERIRTGDFETKKEVPFLEDPEMQKKFPKEYNAALDAIKKKEDARHEFDIALLRDQMSKRTLAEKATDNLSKTLGTVKAITTGIDDSAVAIQTYMSMLVRPRTGAKAFYQHLRQGASQKKFDRWLTALHSSSDFKEMKDMGLDVTEPSSLKEREKEEIFNNRFDGTIKVKGKEYKLIGAPLKPFERAFTTLGNVTRVVGYRTISAKYKKEGYTPEKNPELFKSLAKRLNTETGRGTVNEYVDKANKIVTMGIWSPRLMAQKFNLLGVSDLASIAMSKAGTKGYYRQLHPKERIAAIKDVAQFAITVMALSYGFALANGGEIDDDPLSSTFMDVKLPNGKSYNFTGGFSGYIRAICQFATGKKHKEGKTIKTGRLETAGRFFRGKTPPVTGAVLNLAAGKDFMGKPTTVLNQVVNLSPISLKGIFGQIQNDGAGAFFTQGIPTFFGFNVKNEKDYEKPNPRSRTREPRERAERERAGRD